jgi:proline iminopeptidase
MQEHYFTLPGVRLFVREAGSGTPVVVLHGGPDFNHNYLLPEMDRLADSCRLIYYDQRGRGKSSAGVAAEDVSIETEVEDLERLRQHFGFETMSLLGHSWGALLAMEYASRHAERVAHLVLMNPAPASHADLTKFRETRQAGAASDLEEMRRIASSTAYLAGDLAAEQHYYRLHYAHALARPDLAEVVIQRLRVHFTTEGILKARAIEARLYAHTWLLPDYDLLGRLRHCNCPTLVLHGDRDFVPLSCAEHIAGAVAGARLSVFEDCGHFAYLECPDQTVEAIRTFVSAAPLYGRQLLLLGAKRNAELTLDEIHRYGIDSYGDPDYVSIYGLRPREWFAKGVRVLGRTAVECTRDELGDAIGRDLAAALGSSSAASNVLAIDPFAGSGNTLHWILHHLPGASGLGFELDPVVFRLTTRNLTALDLPIRILHTDFRAGFGSVQVAPGTPVVLFVAPPWGEALDPKIGLDLRKTRPPIVEVLDAAITSFPANPMVVAIQVHETLDPRSATELNSRLEGLKLTIYPLSAAGKNHGILLGTRNLSRSN